ncbi:MAG: VanZ family protein [Planctomycetota bacterium]|nr:MAG: VanZ family protein [Planctomycetota bacterium]
MFAASSLPRGNGVIPLPGPGLDKLAHLFAYLPLAALAGAALRAGGRGRGAAAALALALAAAYGSLDEWHQGWVPGRVPSWQDWVADALGAGLGACGVFCWPTASPPAEDDFREQAADPPDQ